MRKHFFALIFAITLISGTFAQSTLDDLNIIFKHDFENNTLGDYLYDEWQRDFNEPGWSNRQSATDIVRDDNDQINPTKSLQMNYPQGTVGAPESGASWYTNITPVNEVYMSYDMMFMPGFQYRLGGKIPCVQGGDVNAGTTPTGYDGFTGGLMFHEDGLISFYIYFPDAIQESFGETVYWGADYAKDVFSPSHMLVEYNNATPSYCRPGEWHNITYRMVLNTVGTNGGNYDGILEAYFDGILVTQLSHVQFRKTEKLKIDCIRLYTFFGGSTDEWRVPINEWMRLDNVLLYSFKDGIDVPRGNVLSPTNRTINYWRNFKIAYTEVPAAPSSFRMYDRTKSSITLKWNDNSTTEHGFRIYRSLSADQGFEQIADVTSNVTSYTDAGLSLATTYYYRIESYNNAGNSETSSLSATTTGLQLPAVPGEFKMQSLTYTSCQLTWKDVSTNETGFEIERTGPDNTVKKFTIPANQTSYTDEGLQMKANYFYRIRAYNTDGYSDYSTVIIEITTPYLASPYAPTMLKAVAYTDSSITIAWKDNSINESGFVITRQMVADPAQKLVISVSANDTLYADYSLLPGTSYQYVIQAVNPAGSSSMSNKRIATTLSTAEMKRTRTGLIAYYNFTYSPDMILYDQSGYGDPLDLRIQNASAVTWDVSSKLSVKANTMLISLLPAKKITEALKTSKELSLECWIKPTDPGWMDNSRIMSLSSDDNHLGFALDQKMEVEQDDKRLNYCVRLQTAATNESGYPEFIPDNYIPYINLNHVVYTRDSAGVELIYLNGNKSSESYRPDDFTKWSNNYYLRLANESDANHPWQGTFYTVAIYNKALSSGEIRQNFKAGPCDSLTRNSIDYQVKVYPNPIKDYASIQINPVESLDIVPVTSIRISDIYGKIVYNRLVFNPSLQYTDQIDFRSFPAGIYLLQVSSGDQYKSVKLIVNR